MFRYTSGIVSPEPLFRIKVWIKKTSSRTKHACDRGLARRCSWWNHIMCLGFLMAYSDLRSEQYFLSIFVCFYLEVQELEN